MSQPSHVVAASCALAFACTMSLAAQTPRQAGVRAAAPPAMNGLSSKPFSRLFAQRVSEPGMRSRPNSARRFICSTPVLRPDASLDPKFEMQPRDTTTRFTMRIVPPVQCP